MIKVQIDKKPLQLSTGDYFSTIVWRDLLLSKRCEHRASRLFRFLCLNKERFLLAEIDEPLVKAQSFGKILKTFNKELLQILEMDQTIK